MRPVLAENAGEFGLDRVLLRRSLLARHRPDLDWVCEILSPTTRRHDLVDKMPYYAKIGVPHAWLVDLEARTVIVHRLESGRWVTLGYDSDETEARIEPFEAVPLNVAGWWLPADANEDEP